MASTAERGSPPPARRTDAGDRVPSTARGAGARAAARPTPRAGGRWLDLPALAFAPRAGVGFAPFNLFSPWLVLVPYAPGRAADRPSVGLTERSGPMAAGAGSPSRPHVAHAARRRRSRKKNGLEDSAHAAQPGHARIITTPDTPGNRRPERQGSHARIRAAGPRCACPIAQARAGPPCGVAAAGWLPPDRSWSLAWVFSPASDC